MTTRKSKAISASFKKLAKTTTVKKPKDSHSLLELDNSITKFVCLLMDLFAANMVYKSLPSLLDPVFGSYFCNPTRSLKLTLIVIVPFTLLIYCFIHSKQQTTSKPKKIVLARLVTSIYILLIPNFILNNLKTFINLGIDYGPNICYALFAFVPVLLVVQSNLSVFMSNTNFAKKQKKMQFRAYPYFVVVIVFLSLFYVTYGPNIEWPRQLMMELPYTSEKSCDPYVFASLLFSLSTFIIILTQQSKRTLLLSGLLILIGYPFFIIYETKISNSCLCDYWDPIKSMFSSSNIIKIKTKRKNKYDSNFIVLDHKENKFGVVSIIDDQKRDIRVMKNGHSILGGKYKSLDVSIFESFCYMEAVQYVKQPEYNKQKKALIIGLGIGVSYEGLTRFSKANNESLIVNVVEINKHVVEFSKKYFGLKKHINNFYIQGGREFIESSTIGEYDYVLHDVFSGGVVPPELFTTEALNQVKRVLKKNGVLVLNYVGWVEGSSRVNGYEIVKETIRTSFKYIRCFTDPYKSRDELKGALRNIIFFATNHREIVFDEERIKTDYYKDLENNKYKANYYSRYEFILSMFEYEIKIQPTNTPIVVSDKNSSFFWENQQDVAYEHWHQMKNLFPISFWLDY